MATPRTAQPPGRVFWRLDLALSGVLALVALAFTARRAASHILLSNKFLSSDEGVSFLVTDALLHGRTLYRDIAYAYGYIPAYAHVTAARLFGNTIATYLHYFEAMNMVVMVLIYTLLRKILRPWTAFLFTVVAMLPQTITPGSTLGDFIGNTAYPFEKILMLAVALLWRESPRQPWGRALLLGACLGALQGVKFGTGIVLGAALAAVELLSWYRAGFDRGTIPLRLRNNLAVLGGFILLQGLWTVITLASMPPTQARDALWPFYALKNYQEFSGMRYPSWQNLGYFVGVQMVPVLGMVGSFWWLGSQIFRRRAAGSGPDAAADAAGGILILVVFYLLSGLVFFKHVWHYHLFAWILSLGGAYLLLQPWKVVRWGAVAVWGLVFAIFLGLGLGRSHLEPPLVPLTLDDGEQLWVEAGERQQINQMVAYLRAPAAGPGSGAGQAPVVFWPLGAGFHSFFHLPQRGRQYWYVPGLIQPYDMASVRSLARSARWVVRTVDPVEKLAPDPDEWDRRSNTLGRTLDVPTNDDLRSQLTPEREIDPSCWVFSHPQ